MSYYTWSQRCFPVGRFIHHVAYNLSDPCTCGDTDSPSLLAPVPGIVWVGRAGVGVFSFLFPEIIIETIPHFAGYKYCII